MHMMNTKIKYINEEQWAILLVNWSACLPFTTNNPSSNPAEVYNFILELLLKRAKINKKRP